MHRPTQVSVAHWGPSSSSSFEVWVWASSFLLRHASHCLSGDREGVGENQSGNKHKNNVGHKPVDGNEYEVCSMCLWA